jgi:regulator of sigma E protease
MSVVYFLLLVGLLVVIHELGHFLVAKLLDVKVLRFSIGYGPPLVRVKLRETEYQIGRFPLGGYVRILGVEGPETETDPRDIGRSFAARPLWQRLCVVFAGPAANIVLAGAIYFVFFVGHRELPAAVIGDVLPHGPAARSGIEPGDRVLSIDGEAVTYWEDVERAVGAAAGREVRMRLERHGKPVEKYVAVLDETVRKRDGHSRRQGRIGITHAPFIPLVGVLDPRSPAGVAGLRTGDLIISVDGQPVANWTEVDRRIGRTARRTNLVFFRGTELPGVPQIRLLDARFADVVPESLLDDKMRRTTYTGLERAEMFVAQVDPGSPADMAGLRPGDVIAALDNQPVSHWLDLDQRLQSAPEKTWRLTWKRAGDGGAVQTVSAELTQVLRKQLDDYGNTVTRLVFGARNDVDRGRGAMITIDGRFGYAMTKAVERTGETLSMMVGGFFSILAGDSPSEALGGPLMAYRLAAVSSERGWEGFWLMLALISINLALINLLPIPMLDGGHLVVFAIEGFRGRPLSTKQRDRVQLVGLVVVGLITVLALRNDVTRYLLQ